MGVKSWNLCSNQAENSWYHFWCSISTTISMSLSLPFTNNDSLPNKASYLIQTISSFHPSSSCVKVSLVTVSLYLRTENYQTITVWCCVLMCAVSYISVFIQSLLFSYSQIHDCNRNSLGPLQALLGKTCSKWCYTNSALSYIGLWPKS